MDASRRKEIEKISTLAEELKERIEALHAEEEYAYDNLPESLQDSDRGQAMQYAMENLEYAADDLQECFDHLEEAST